MKSTILVLLVAVAADAGAGAVRHDADGALRIVGDKYGMNWILKTDGTQYAPVTEEDAWGTVELGVRS